MLRSQSRETLAAITQIWILGFTEELLVSPVIVGLSQAMGSLLWVGGRLGKMMVWSDWGGVGSVVSWRFLGILDRNGAQVFVVGCGVCWVCRRELGVE